jgi:ATP-dependent DNA helicase RecG
MSNLDLDGTYTARENKSIAAGAGAPGRRQMLYNGAVTLTAASEVKYIPGVGPQRARILASRGIDSVGDLLAYLPFRYEDRTRFSHVAEVRPGGVYTVQGVVAGAGLARFTRGRGAIYHLLVRDETGTLPCKFFHGGYLEGRFRSGQRIVVHGAAELDPYRPGRIEMINPQYELLGTEPADSTEAGRIVPIYEAIGAISSRMLRRTIHAALENLAARRHRSAAAGAARPPLGPFPSRRCGLRTFHCLRDARG